MDSYNGWPNKETWAASLWLGNTEHLYNWHEAILVDVRRGLLDRYEAEARIKEQFVDWRADLAEGTLADPEIRMMIVEIGSLWRVEWSKLVY